MTANAPFAYFGGKTNIAERIVDLLPAHEHYVEPFAGSLAVLLAKPRSAMETVNDLDGDLMTFWRVLRNQPADLAARMALTPHSRAEHQAAYELTDVDDLERARRVWVLLSQGRTARLTRTGWRYAVEPRVGSMGALLRNYVERALLASQRIAGVSLEARDALDVIADYGRNPKVLLYCDPPYLGSTRAANYRHEITSDADHAELAVVLHACTAAVVLSGYDAPLYQQLYADWHRTEIKAWTGNGLRAGDARAEGERTEVLWSNRPFPATEPSLFDEEVSA